MFYFSDRSQKTFGGYIKISYQVEYFKAIICCQKIIIDRVIDISSFFSGFGGIQKSPANSFKLFTLYITGYNVTHCGPTYDYM